jgi:hypothetical protein
MGCAQQHSDLGPSPREHRLLHHDLTVNKIDGSYAFTIDAPAFAGALFGPNGDEFGLVLKGQRRRTFRTSSPISRL